MCELLFLQPHVYHHPFNHLYCLLLLLFNQQRFFLFCAGLQGSDQCFLSYDCPWLSFPPANHHKELCSCTVLDNYLLLLVLVTFVSPESGVRQFLEVHAWTIDYSNDIAGLWGISILKLNI